jgi:hypothetical protein
MVGLLDGRRLALVKEIMKTLTVLAKKEGHKQSQLA